MFNSFSFSDPGSHSGGIVAPGHTGPLRSDRVCAEVHRTARHRSHHQPDRTFTLYAGWSESRGTLGYFSSVSQEVTRFFIYLRLMFLLTLSRSEKCSLFISHF